MIQAVIFDMDGTLFDTEVIYGHGWIKAGLTKEQYYQLIGTSRVSIDKKLVEWGFNLEKVRKIRAEAVEQELQEKGVALKPGTLTCLQWLKEQGIPAAIATSSAKSVADRYLAMTELSSYFAEVISGNTLERGKPFPDIFLMAADLLHRNPDECLVVEDSFNGVRLVPGGFGERGIEGKIEAARYARENNVPYFGICLGMQMAVIEFARNVLGYSEANSEEFDAKTKYPVIHIMEEQKDITQKGGTIHAS